MRFLANNAPFRILGFCALLLLAACQQKSEASYANPSPAPLDESSLRAKPEAALEAEASSASFQDAASKGDIFSSAAAVPGAIDSIKQFVRTAEMRFRVKNTADATLRIEDIVLRNGGFVLGSNLNTEVELRQTTPTSRDSALETTRFTIHSQLLIRVPFHLLDTTLRSIGRISDFLDVRHVNAEDVGLQMLEQSLSRLRESIYRTDLENSAENKISPKADRARTSRAASDQARIETLKIEDKIRFSTVTVDIYQLPQVRQIMVGNTDFQIPKLSFFAQLADAFHAGTNILTGLLFGIIRLWGLILLMVLGYFTWKWLRKYKKPGLLKVKES